MNKVFYNKADRKTFLQYEKNKFILFLDEQETELIPDISVESEDTETLKSNDPVQGYTYTGSLEDGGTLIDATEPTRDAFINGLIRLKYSVDAVEAIQNNRMAVLINKKHDKAEEYTARWDELQAYREECKEAVDALLSRTAELEG